MLERALNAPPRFSRRRFLATSTTASLAFALASQPERLSAQAASTETSGSGGGSANNVNYAGYLKFDPADGQKSFDGAGAFYQIIENLTPPASCQVASPNGYNPQNVTPPPLVEINYTAAHLAIVGGGPAISGRLNVPDFAPEKNLINEAIFSVFPAILTKYTQTPIVGGVPQTNHTSPVQVGIRALMPPNQWPSVLTRVDFAVTPPVWVGNPTIVKETRGPNSIIMVWGTDQTAPSGSSFEVTGELGSICRLTGKLTLAADQVFTGYTLGPLSVSMITIPANVYETTFEWRFGILKWNLATGQWDVQS